MYQPMVPPELRRTMADKHRLFAVALWSVFPLVGLIILGTATSPEQDVDLTVHPAVAAVVIVFVLVVISAMALMFSRRGRVWRQVIPVAAPVAVGTGTVVSISTSQKWGRSATTVDVDHSGRWRFETSHRSDDVSRPGDRVTIEWYNLDGKVIAAAYQHEATGQIHPVTARHQTP